MKAYSGLRTLAMAAAAIILMLSASGMAQSRDAEPVKPIEPEDVNATLKRVGDWQLAHPAPFDPRNWAIAPLYDGLIDASLVTGEPQYLAAVLRAGRRIGFRPGPIQYHADDHATAHAWLRLYLMAPARDRDPAMLEPIKDRFDEIVRKPIKEELSFTDEPKAPGVAHTDRWTWADALYMAPPTLALLAAATRDERYLHFIDIEFRAAYDALFDPKERLFYRDSRFIDQRTPNDKKVFWSRGNGWVYAGLALLIDALPPDYPTRDFYIQLFREMSPVLLGLQQPQGMWHPSLLDPEHVDIGETSGTALFTYAMAWGVRQGLLDQGTYWPAVERAWHGMRLRVRPDGAVEASQPVGAAPEKFDPNSRQAFGTGSFLMAAAEILRVLDAAAKVASEQLFIQARARAEAAPDLSVPEREHTSDEGKSERRRKSEVEREPASALKTGADDREYSVKVMTRIAEPVLDALSNGELKKRLPIHDWERHRSVWTHYEAFARTLAGIAPWLELGPDDTPEGRQRARFIDLARKSLNNATDPKSPDFLNFGTVPDQPLVESAYLAYALLHAPRQLWEPLDESQRERVLGALRTARAIELKHNNNWVLFPAMVEAALWRFGGDARIELIEKAVKDVESWYLGDGIYGDGPNLHWDYYNSYVIHPMLQEVLRVAEAKRHPLAERLPRANERGDRYAQILERLIAPEGTFPVIGRSSAYRFGALFHLANRALIGDLPQTLDPGAVRGAITAVVRRMVDAPGTFDEQGWLNLGAVGSQPGLREEYNATGSLYVCLTGLVHLGLPADDPFWTAPPSPWTQRRIWAGEDVARDHARESK